MSLAYQGSRTEARHMFFKASILLEENALKVYSISILLLYM